MNDKRFILAVTAWRFHQDRNFIEAWLGHYAYAYGGRLHVRVGDASGGDAITARFCQDMHISYYVYYAHAQKHGWPAAGPIRNRDMLTGAEEDRTPADELLAFPQPNIKPRIPGSGSWGCVGEAFVQGIHVTIPPYGRTP